MEWRTSKRKLKAVEDFRFFDELHYSVRQALHEAYYEYNSLEAMNRQHQFYGSNQPIEELAELYKERDQSRFEEKMRPKLEP